MKQNKALLLRILLTFIVLYALGSFIWTAPGTIGKDFFETVNFQNMQDEYAKKLRKYVLSPIDEEATMNGISVSQEEIEHYRTYYGTEAEQILNIQEQYASKIDEANSVESPNEAYINALMTERDQKINEVQKNFTDDQVVMEKIKAIKLEAVKKYFEEYYVEKEEFIDSYPYFGYSFRNVETDDEKLHNTEVSKVYSIEKRMNAREPFKISVRDYTPSEWILNPEVTIVSKDESYRGTIFISKDYIEKGGLSWEYRGFILTKWLNYMLWVVGLAAFVLLLTKYKWSLQLFKPLEPYFIKIKEKPYDVHLAILFLLFYMTNSMFDTGANLISRIAYGSRHMFTLWFVIETAFGFAFRFALLGLTIFLVWAAVKRWQEESYEELWQSSFVSKFSVIMKNLFLNRSIGMQTLFMFFVFYLGGFGLFVGMQDGGVFLFYMFLFIFILVPTLFVYLARMGYLNKIMKQTEKMAQGQFTEPIKVKGKSPLAQHAANLNAMQEGVRQSVTEQAKSERLKTELITNVSHDLRTPLTSIITYTDLLKNPDLTPEEREKYVAVLDKKAERLKVLIEDLFEVSKMASGNMEVVKQKVDIAQLLQQITGEHASDFEESNLDLRVAIASKPIMANVDGQKLWRVFDNLLNNARKYSMSGTRVYVDLREDQNRVILAVKNISKYELEGDAMELTERFKRADVARHTEGSGLGLAIATSIVHLHGGTLDVSADGDLFKVTVSLPKL